MKQGNFIISSDPPEDDVQDAAPEFEARPFTVSAQWHGKRLDLALSAAAPEFSRSYLQQLVERGAVTLNTALVTRSAHKVKAGDTGTIELRPTPQSQAFKPQAMDLAIVYEDAHLMVIDKPAGLVVHPAPGNWSGTLLNGLLARDRNAADLPRAGIVHRLDKDTSGLMVIARTRTAMDLLVRRIAAREVSRQYVALAHGAWRGAAHRRVEAAIGRDPRQRLRMAVTDNGKPAATRFDLLQQAGAGCWVRATLETGRTHQIRVHMAHIGHPLVGDTLYGGMPAVGLTRQALHAYRLAFAHPVTDAPLEFHAELPQDLQQALGLWGLRYNANEWLSSHAP